MRKILVVALAALPFSSAFAGMPRHPLPTHRAGEVLVTYRDEPAATQAVQLKSSLALTAKRALREGRVELLAVPSYMTVENAIEALRHDPAVAYVRPNFLRVPRQTTPNDALFGELWGLHSTGQANYAAPGDPLLASIPGADMDMLAAWDDPNVAGADFNRVGSSSVTIAIIDDSFSTSHQDLAANFVAGCNFESTSTCSNPNVSPVGGEQHGTLVAGAAGAIGNNAVGVAGTAWNARLMPLKFDFDTAGHLAALDYAAANGADIINASFGGPGFDQEEEDAIAALAADGILYVTAAGNDDSNTDFAQLNYPSNLDAPNIVSVAATNRQDNIASFSQHGALTTDVAAPGLQIVTTANGMTNYFNPPGVSGTSFSSPYTAGIAALLKSHLATTPGFLEMKARLIEGAEPVNGITARTAGGRVNAAQALALTARPSLVIQAIDWVDPNDRLDPGDTLSVDITLHNLWQNATGITGTLTADGDSGVTVTSGSVNFPDVANDATGTARFDLTVPANVTEHRYVTFTLQLAAAGGYTATRGFIAEIGELLADQTVTQEFVPVAENLYDEFHAWHFDFDGTLPPGHNQLVFETTSSAAGVTSPDIDLLVKRGEPPRYSITVGINPETQGGFFCTSGTTSNCLDPATPLSAGPNGTERVAITNPVAGTYHLVVVNFAQLQNGLTYTLRAYTRTAPPPSGGGGGGGSLPVPVLTLFALVALRRRLHRAA